MNEIDLKLAHGLRKAFNKILDAKDQNAPIIISNDGKVLEVKPEDLNRIWSSSK